MRYSKAHLFIMQLLWFLLGYWIIIQLVLQSLNLILKGLLAVGLHEEAWATKERVNEWMTLDRQMTGIVQLGEKRVVEPSAKGKKGEVIMQFFQTTPPHTVT